MTSAELRPLGPLLLLALAACGGSSPGPAPAPASAGEPNVLPVSVNGVGCSAGSYLNKPCVSVKICVPGTATCQVVGDLLLDTGSVGLRIFSQALTITLPQSQVAGQALAECIGYLDGSAQWGPIASASVTLAGEPSVLLPVQVIDATYRTRPAACASAEAGPTTAGFNGILGVGIYLEDCGPGCAGTANNGMYFTCAAGAAGCTGAAVPLAAQLRNPVAALPVDNNGMVLRLPAVGAGGAGAVEGTLLLGIGTRANNGPPAGLVAYPLDASGEFRTTLGGVTTTAFVDTGSNGLFFAAPASLGLPACGAPNGGWYCPPTTVTLGATNAGAQGAPSAPLGFQVANFAAQVAPASVNVSALVAGSLPASSGFDWGLPFHLGRDVYLGLEARTSDLGAGPLVAW